MERAIGQSSALERLVYTDTQLAPLLIRLMLGSVIFPHGAQKMLGWFGGTGWQGTLNEFADTYQMSEVTTVTVILIQVFGSLLLIAGFMTRLMAFSMFVLFVGIIFTTRLPYGFFLNWNGQQAGEGFEYHLLVLAMSGALLVSGGGRYSLDLQITGWVSREWIPRDSCFFAS